MVILPRGNEHSVALFGRRAVWQTRLKLAPRMMALDLPIDFGAAGLRLGCLPGSLPIACDDRGIPVRARQEPLDGIPRPIAVLPLPGQRLEGRGALPAGENRPLPLPCLDELPPVLLAASVLEPLQNRNDPNGVASGRDGGRRTGIIVQKRRPVALRHRALVARLDRLLQREPALDPLLGVAQPRLQPGRGVDNPLPRARSAPSPRRNRVGRAAIPRAATRRGRRRGGELHGDPRGPARVASSRAASPSCPAIAGSLA